MKRSATGWFTAAALTAFGLFATGMNEAAGYSLTLSSVTGSGTNFTYTYSASITANQEAVVAGNFIRIFDFATGVPLASTVAAGPTAAWVVSTAYVNPTPPPNVILQHGDDPATPNVTFTYTGSTPLTGPLTLGNFTIQSIYGTAGTLKDFAGQSTNTSTTPATLIDSRSDVLVPTVVPEPASLVSGGIGLVLLGIGYASRSRRKAVA